jgi:predicted RNA-binding protein YlxR (DUF448 family)
MVSVPLRMCAACRKVEPKRELLRLVRTPEGELQYDPSGKMRGRGAYVHRDPDCLSLLFRGKRLSLAFKRDVSPEEASRLKADLEAALSLPVLGQPEVEK